MYHVSQNICNRSYAFEMYEIVLKGICNSGYAFDMNEIGCFDWDYSIRHQLLRWLFGLHTKHACPRSKGSETHLLLEVIILALD